MSDDFELDVRRAVHAVDGEHPGDTSAAVDELLATGVCSYFDLISATTHANPEVRRTACWLLGRLRVAAGIPALLAAMYDEDATLRRFAAAALGELEDPSTAAALIDRMVDDGDEGVRVIAALSLGSLTGSHVVDALRAMVQDTTQPARVRGAAAEALGIAGADDPSLVPVLLFALEDPSPDVRFNAAYGLGQFRSVVGSEVLQALERVAATDDGETSDGRVRDRAQTTLDELRMPSLDPA